MHCHKKGALGGGKGPFHVIVTFIVIYWDLIKNVSDVTQADLRSSMDPEHDLGLYVTPIYVF